MRHIINTNSFRIGLPILTLILIGCSEAVQETDVSIPAPPAIDHSNDQPSQIISRADVKGDRANWGTFRAYFTQDTFGTSPVLTGVADIKAGEQIHPPHRHADEEFLMITRGKGEWYLNGEVFPAKAGDILYAKPWDYHGVKAADDSGLQFVVFKWSNKAIPNIDPEPSLPEELAE